MYTVIIYNNLILSLVLTTNYFYNYSCRLVVPSPFHILILALDLFLPILSLPLPPVIFHHTAVYEWKFVQNLNKYIIVVEGSITVSSHIQVSSTVITLYSFPSIKLSALISTQ